MSFDEDSSLYPVVVSAYCIHSARMGKMYFHAYQNDSATQLTDGLYNKKNDLNLTILRTRISRQSREVSPSESHSKKQRWEKPVTTRDEHTKKKLTRIKTI